MVNGPNHIYIERSGKIQRVDRYFLNDEHVLRIIDRIITPLGRRIDASSPRVDARLPDGSRVNAVIEPLSLVGPVITVRKFPAKPITVDDLIGFGTATPEMFDFLRACVEARLNVFVSGGTGSGKTTTPQRPLVLHPGGRADRHDRGRRRAPAPPDARRHRSSRARRTSRASGEITIRDLLRNALHMRPDRIIVGECRGGEALDMLQAMTTGQDGSLSTGHANTPTDMLRRLETMVLMTGYELPLRAIREQIASAVDLIVHTARLKDGSRKVVNITEVYGIDDDEILTQDIFDVPADRRRRTERSKARSSRPGSARRSWPSSSRSGDRAATRRVRHPARGPGPTRPAAQGQGSLGNRRTSRPSRSMLPASAGGRAGHRRRHGLRLVDRARRSGDRPARPGRRSRSRRDSASRT